MHGVILHENFLLELAIHLFVKSPGSLYDNLFVMIQDIGLAFFFQIVLQIYALGPLDLMYLYNTAVSPFDAIND